ncbi:putative septum site-determining protein MinC [Collibacillus ludicampi]|jgi:septum site-determining protein MinC|uniref:Probable septum site-determining protein MinC n=1 Tax=Collibacillus ludicampi TaxID=2771369 RepID=A0AAV4LA02_9BACL|nr:septum site-determining protein MinC [Collibacillus ludicampi]GIM44600.1 putative septum site-determining protein MinC [Collibacillus ludicampi]
MGNRMVWELPPTMKPPVTIKGIRDGLVFILHDQCPFEDILHDLERKIAGSHGQFLVGPLIRVTVLTGKRELTPEQKESVRKVLSARGNLIIQAFHSSHEKHFYEMEESPPLIYRGTVRSGQVVSHQGDIVVIGDVNPGGLVMATGNVYIMGTLRGVAHAGCTGDENAIIAAVYFQPSQLRIGRVISRAPDTEDRSAYEATEMEFAYLKEGQMAVEKMQYLHMIRTRD